MRLPQQKILKGFSREKNFKDESEQEEEPQQ